MAERYEIVPIGRVRSPFRDPGEAPRQGREAAVEATIEVEPAYLDALEGIDRWKKLLIVCWLHRADRGRLKVRPRLNPDNPLTGVFSTRSPSRPNPLAIYTADLLEVRGTALRVLGLDAVDGTPVVDIRPHISRLDD
jgi:L-fuculose-phosphate aldolase